MAALKSFQDLEKVLSVASKEAEELKQLAAERPKLVARITQLERDLDSAKEHLQHVEAKSRRLGEVASQKPKFLKRISELERSLEKTEKRHAEAEAAVVRLRSEKSEIANRVAKFEDTRKRYERELRVAEEKLGDSRAQHYAAITKLKRQLVTLEDARTDKKRLLELRAEHRHLRERFQSVEGRLNAEISAHIRAKEAAEEAIKELNQRILVSRGKHGRVTRALRRKEKEAEALLGLNKGLEAANAELLEAIAEAEDSLNSKAQHCEDLQRRLNDVDRSFQIASLLCAELSKRPVALEAAERRLAQAQRELNKLRIERDRAFSDLSDATDALKAARGAHEAKIDNTGLELQRLNRKVQGLIEDRERLTLGLAQTEAENVALKSQIERYRRSLSDHQSRSASPSRTG